MAKAATKSGGGEQSIEQLQARYRELDRRKTRAEAQHEEALKRLEELKAEALERYGTHDLEALRQKLREMKEENEAKRAAYQAQLEAIESKLAEVEAKFAQAGAPQDGDDEAQR